MWNVVWSFFDNISKGFYLCNVVLRAFIRTTLSRIFSCAVLSGASWTTLHKAFSCAILAHSKQATFMSKMTYTMLYRPCWDNIVQEYCLVNVVQTRLRQHCTRNYLCNVGPERTDMFSQESNLYNVILICLCQRCIRELLMQCWPTAHEQLCTGK